MSLVLGGVCMAGSSTGLHDELGTEVYGLSPSRPVEFRRGIRVSLEVLSASGFMPV